MANKRWCAHSCVLGKCCAILRLTYTRFKLRFLDQMRRVLRWWQSQPLSAGDQQDLLDVLVWLSDLVPVIKLTVSRKRKVQSSRSARYPSRALSHPRQVQEIGELREEGAWLDAAPLVQAIERARLRALRKLVECGNRPCEGLARYVHDVLLASLLFGYLPPLRISSLLAVTFDGQGCAKRHCRVESCLGNRLEVGATGLLGLVLEHHKTASSKGRGALSIPSLPAKVAELLASYLKHCRGVLAGDSSVRVLFLSSHGKALAPAACAAYFREHVLPAVHLKHLSFAPRYLRHIFVSERLSPEAVPGPATAYAAKTMGNSPRAWPTFYLLDDKHAAAEQGARDMLVWHHTMLGQQA